MGEVDQRGATAGENEGKSVGTHQAVVRGLLARARAVNSSRVGCCVSSIPSITIICVP